jgi:hypothetical protein
MEINNDTLKTIKTVVIIIIILLGVYLIKKNKHNKENMENIPAIKQRLKKHYNQIGNNVIYAHDFKKMFEIGNFYFTEGEYDLMIKYYRPIIDEYNKIDNNNTDNIFICKDELFNLYKQVQYDIMRSVDLQETCQDSGSCLDTNFVLATTNK